MADTTAGQQTTALGTAAMSQSSFKQSNTDRTIGWIGSAVIAISTSLGESWDRDPGALCWHLRSLGRFIFGFLFMSITCLGHFLDQKQTAAKPVYF